jgi:transcriptional regulator with XRE-family HTH domain
MAITGSEERGAFFTAEMGLRLKGIRREHGLTQDQLAERIGLTCKGRWNQIAQLEQGRYPNPALKFIARYLRACGAKWAEFTDLLESISLPELGMVETPVNARNATRDEPASQPPAGTDVHRQEPEKEPRVNTDGHRGGQGVRVQDPMREIVRKTQEETRKYTEKSAYPRQGAPMAPAQQTKAAAAYQEYRLLANTVKRSVFEYLCTLDMNPIKHYGYQKVAERTLGALRRADREGKSRQRLVGRVGDFIAEQRLDENVCRRVQEIVTEVYDKRTED